MSKEEIDLLKKNVELILRKIREYYSNPETEADSLVNMIRQEGYQIRRWSKPDKYYLVPEDERPHYCYGCFNEHGDCGTPCVECEKADLFKKEWNFFMMFPNEFIIYKRREQ